MYRFKLEALLNHHRHQQEVCQKELAQAQRKVAEEQKKLRRKIKQKRENVLMLQKKQKESTNIPDIIVYLNYLQQLTRDIEDQKRSVQEASKIANQKRNELIFIMKKCKTLEMLKEKGRQRHQQKLMQDEAKFMDELASIRHARKV